MRLWFFFFFPIKKPHWNSHCEICAEPRINTAAVARVTFFCVRHRANGA